MSWSAKRDRLQNSHPDSKSQFITCVMEGGDIRWVLKPVTIVLVTLNSCQRQLFSVTAYTAAKNINGS